MRVYELNGFYYIKDCDGYYDWLSDQENVPYFMLNNVTRKKFIQDILPLIKSGQCACDKIVLDKIRYFTQAPTRAITDQYTTIVEPDPVNKPLMEHQIEAVTRMITYPKYGFFLGTGTGKTLIAISFLMTMNLTKALIITPKKVIKQYKKELDKYIPNNQCVVTNYEQVSNYTNENFDYTTTLNNCTLNQTTGGNYTIPLTHNGNTASTRYIASNLYQDNYLNIDKYKTIEVEPSPSPSPGPETPTTNGFDSINPYYWILPSFLLMLLIMYKFINGIFSK